MWSRTPVWGHSVLLLCLDMHSSYPSVLHHPLLPPMRSWLSDLSLTTGSVMTRSWASLGIGCFLCNNIYGFPAAFLGSLNSKSVWSWNSNKDSAACSAQRRASLSQGAKGKGQTQAFELQIDAYLLETSLSDVICAKMKLSGCRSNNFGDMRLLVSLFPAVASSAPCQDS